MKKSIAVLTVIIMVLGCFGFVGCSKKEDELSRAKRILEIEFANRSPFVSMEYTLRYHSCTFYTVEKTTAGGHFISGKIFYVDQFGDKYYENYTALVEKDSWFPEINRSTVKKFNE